MEKTPRSIAIEKGQESIAALLEHWPRVVPLRTLCLRVIRSRSNGVAVPQWVPPRLLQYPTLEEMIGVLDGVEAAASIKESIKPKK